MTMCTNLITRRRELRQGVAILPAFTDTFVPFAAILVVALLAAEVSQNLVRYRALYCLWATVALVIPAVVYRLLGRDSVRGRYYWLLSWTWAFVAFLVHLAYTAWGLGEPLGFMRWLLLIWWTLDLAVGWLGTPDAGWTRRPRGLLHLVVLLWLLASVLPGEGLGQGLGIGLLAAVLISWLAAQRLRAQPASA